MAIQLKKGQKIDLTKGNPGLKHIRLGLGWDTNMFDGGDDFDLDVSLFMVGKSGKVEQDEDFKTSIRSSRTFRRQQNW